MIQNDAPIRANTPPGVAEQDPGAADLAQARCEAWALLTGARPYTGTGRPCLRKLANPKHRCTNACRPMPWALDHAEWWKGPVGEFVVTAHPYGLTDDTLEDLARIGRETGAQVSIDPDWSWYWPGTTSLVVVWGRPWAGKAR